MKFCPECGKQLDEDAKFCPDCGTVQEDDALSSTPEAPYVLVNPETPFITDTQPVQSTPVPASRRNNLLPWLIGCGGILLALIIAGVIVAVILISQRTAKPVDVSDLQVSSDATPVATITENVESTTDPAVETTEITPEATPEITPEPSPDASTGATAVTQGEDLSLLVSISWISYISDVDDSLDFNEDGSFYMYTIADTTDETTGTFKLDEAAQAITFICSEYTRTYKYLLNDTILILCDDKDNYTVYEAVE